MPQYQFTRYAGLDFETYSDVDLKTHGLARYVASPHFRPLIASVQVLDPTMMQWDVERLDFINRPASSIDRLNDLLQRDVWICAHNMGFERAVLNQMRITTSDDQWIDSAVVARVNGFASSLANASRQALRDNKIAEGKDLINLFCKPNKHMPGPRFDPAMTIAFAQEWRALKDYCDQDAILSAELCEEFSLSETEREFAIVTQRMNERGWHCNVEDVEEMQRRFNQNSADLIEEFQVAHDAHDLNINSPIQLKKWCEDRGIKAKSFDKQHVASMLKQLAKRAPLSTEQQQVRALLELKQELGGTSLKKLQTIKDTEHRGYLFDQYVHAGAAQTLRTSGRSVQMQNLARMSNAPIEMSSLHTPANYFSNDDLSANVRQVFDSRYQLPSGQIVVGDFSSIESRGLAWLADEKWKLTAYDQGQDLYKVLASNIFGVPVSSVTKAQRQTGKVGELSCGYGAGPGAVKDFAQKMGVEMSEQEAKDLVVDWRDANPEITALWADLETALRRALTPAGQSSMHLANAKGSVRFLAQSTPRSLQEMEPATQLVTVHMLVAARRPSGALIEFSRVFHGVHVVGNSIVYYRAMDSVNGPLWSKTFVNPKTKQKQYYTLYGGKLAGLLTQSLCREIFFHVLKNVDESSLHPYLVGQFHDEIVLDVPSPSVNSTMELLAHWMKEPVLAGFPQDAEIKHDYRYTK